ncbi:hypothetical protein Rsub_06302 [Raphidocelis subcapitata]|uniref:Uncharacterized protein n=1 Tax=Raphidocelis subcapitata TaxID=307507 RepID=A0A2V0P3U6_9CHLO|nr:hypothetical protein Rsub_06302 [Raphidocelis subcapitata]|eukprot:GBF93582.1 hypothetical protein Rsub_06302 [Raphidocelis subcapitata]
MRVSTAIVYLAALFAAAGGAAAARAPADAPAAPPLEPTAAAPGGPLSGLPPVFPDSYHLEWDFSIPYIELLQPQGLKYRVRAWVDRASDSVRVDFGEGEQQNFFLGDAEYSVFPRKHERVCKKFAHGGGPILASDGARAPASDAARAGLLSALRRALLGAPRAAAGAAAPAAGLLGTPVLPDLSAGGWEPTGESVLDGRAVVQWRLKRRQEAGEKTDEYFFYVTTDGAPVKLHSVGRDFFEHSHYDEYIYDFTAWQPGPVDPSVFKLPDLCSGLEAAPGEARRGAGALLAAAALPAAHLEGRDRAHYVAFSRQQGREHEGPEDFARRAAAFGENKARIDAHNAAVVRGGPDAPTHTLALNRFGDWTREEREGALLGRGLVRSGKPRMPPLEVFQRTLPDEELPDSLDWRGSPADFAVKDQAQCGSCYAFAATGTLEGAWFVHTGNGRSFSEQQMIDCAWDEGPKGCDGGDPIDVFEYVAKKGGIAQTQDYPYRGLNGYCRDNVTRMEGLFRGYARVPSRDEAAVREALLMHGPLSVGVDADFDFAFYSGGIYHEKRCALRPAKLNHAVVLVGYGSDRGRGFWVVKNSWSKYWGVDGYIKIRRAGNDCGIASDAVYALVAEGAAAPGAPERARAAALAGGRARAARGAAGGAGWGGGVAAAQL